MDAEPPALRRREAEREYRREESEDAAAELPRRAGAGASRGGPWRPTVVSF